MKTGLSDNSISDYSVYQFESLSLELKIKLVLNFRLFRFYSSFFARIRSKKKFLKSEKERKKSKLANSKIFEKKEEIINKNEQE